jgi:hypothetical protein
MPPTKDVYAGGKEESRSIKMANGKKVKEMIGFRPMLTAEWDWVPADTMAELHSLLRSGGFFTVTYPDPAEETKTGVFEIDYPQSKVFRFEGDVATWHGVTLTMSAQEVE